MPAGNDPLPPAPSPALVYDGRIGELYGIFLPNLLLTIITFGFYRFWAITRLRRYVWSHMRFQNERFEYTGTGVELFLGFILAMAIIIGLMMVFGLLSAGAALIARPLIVLPIVLLYVTIPILALAAIFSAQRYRLSRTLWRGIRGGMRGSAIRYGVRAFFYLLLSLLTFLQLTPWTTLRLIERRLNASGFGDLRFACAGRARRIYLPFLAQFVVFVVLEAIFAVLVFRYFRLSVPHVGPIIHVSDPTVAPPPRLPSPLPGGMLDMLPIVLVTGLFAIGIVVGLVRAFYLAALAREVAGNTCLGPLCFLSSIGGFAILRFILGNLAILIFTLGLGYPIVIHRAARLLARNLAVIGMIDPDTLRQNTAPASALGEGMFQVLDSGGGLL
ncbi:MAG: DUF898 family protein [Rhodospirillales bacterium]|nr:DUF898 family protein [Rhodospirillales bacterium]